ncbi:SurA N-terminal domain-containing protein [Candidatus Magnetominusculus xianensis]|uniref:Peptidyl-prolyl cis-trans isomerase n=1 Tax=Candidatus Magnetominusculus xianensis TaxID=1748249 RepID=A0ABR5SJX4_9BACT|nr:SurA N-terminal domain-containing protein [Candidatus Magnetominusculus xianensis]KWT92833.1 peptidyl-prolyl cis-trans isomerase [Candidatus Magnetominusculus xianensis]MBF0403422.1 SurA N-terminal domain-containing protein [Nitrospirota bacterium]
MIKFMHKYAKFFYVFFFLIIISFIFFYVGPIDKSLEQLALVEIGEKKIYPDEYWRMYENMKNYYSNALKEKFTPEMEKELRLKDIVLEGIIDNELLLSEAINLGIKVTDEEVNDAITHDPSFIRDGVFRKEIYLRTLELSRLNPRYFEQKKRDDLTIQKMRRLIELAANTKAEIPKEFAGALKGNEQAMESIMKSIQDEQKAKTLRSYMQGLRKIIPVKVRAELIAWEGGDGAKPVV